MPLWYYDKKDLKSTPSIHDGVDQETEQRYRREGCRFILDLGFRLGLYVKSIFVDLIIINFFFYSIDDRKQWVLELFFFIVFICFIHLNNIQDM
jgi:hypothetical protein